MKMTKAKNIIISILFVVSVIIGTSCLTIYAKNVQESYALGLSVNTVNISNGSDIISIRAISGSAPIAGYYIGKTNNINNATYYKAPGQNYIYISLLNGTYYVWVRDQAGNIARYSKTITVKKSCSSSYLNNAKGSGVVNHCYYTSDGQYLEETLSDQLVTCADGYVRDESATRVVEDDCSLLTAASIKSMGLSRKVCRRRWSYSCVASQKPTNNSLSVISATVSNEWSNNNKQITVTAKPGANSIAGYYISTNSAKPNGSASWVSSSSTTWTTSQGSGTYYVWVKDSAGNISSNYKSVTVSKIETTPPHIDSVIPSSINHNLTINASDEGGSGIAAYYISSDSTPPNLSSAWNNSNSNTYTIEKEPGKYYIWVRDVAGNISASKMATIAASSKNDNNSLQSLSIKGAELSPEFDPNVLEYNVISQVSKVVIDAALQDSNANFETNYGPRTVNLQNGQNTISLKIKSALGNVKEYKINVTYNGKSSSSIKDGARLKSLSLNSGNLTFDPDITEYRMYVPKSLEKLEVKAIPEDSNAEVKIENPETLQIGDNKVIITVTATDGTIKVYTLNIIKKETEVVSTNNYLKSLTITGYEIEFNKDKLNYAINLGKRTYLNINAIAEDSNAEVTIDNTQYLTKSSIIKIMVRAEDGSARIYQISLNKKTNSLGKIILIIIGVIFGIILIGYIILRLLGYNIYINFGAIKDFFIKLFKRND